MKLLTMCQDCGELVDADTVHAHFNVSHGANEDGWRFAHWPDGELVVVEPW